MFDISTIVSHTGRSKSSVIPLLQAIQAQYGYLPREVLRSVCDATDITPAEIIGVATFYSQFRLEPVGKHIIRVCVGTACHVKGAMPVHDAFSRHLKLGANRTTDDQGLYTLEQVSCLGCCTLAPVVQVDDVTYGHVQPGKVASVLKDFASREQSDRKQAKRLSLKGENQGEIRIGLGSCCIASGSGGVRQEVERAVQRNRLKVDIKHVGCVGMCHQVPLIEVLDSKNRSNLYAKVNPKDIKYIINSHFQPPSLLQRIKNEVIHTIENLDASEGEEGVESYPLNTREEHVSAFLDQQVPIATEHRGVLSPLDFKEYQRKGGFAGLKRAFSLSPQDVIEEVKASGLKGRGGAGFPSGIKWETVAAQPMGHRYVICNGDEGDPGAFMDRMLLESYPFRVIEGMVIAAYAVGASEGIFYIRAEYPLAVSRIHEALEISRTQGLLGDNILDSKFSFNARIAEGAGAFVCGEETALIASIEGQRGFPRIRPPYPAQTGLWGKPTLVNNTETLAMVPFIMREGHQQFASLGTGGSRGSKVFALAGKIRRGGLIEVPMGISIRTIVEDIGGGIANGRRFKAIQIGGPSGGCVPHYLADTPIDFQSLGEVGAMMGSGGLVALDHTDCMVDMARYFLSFTQHESCGKCTFCRVGTRRMLNILNSLCEGKAKPNDLDELEKLAQWTKRGSLCGLGKTAPNPVLSTLKYFRNEYEAHLQGQCPAGKCKALVAYSVTDTCNGCTICAQRCPVEAIAFTPHQRHTINQSLCTRCDVCRQECPIGAIEVR